MCAERIRRIDDSVNFDCRCCTTCCASPWRITVKAENIGRIEGHDWSKYPKLQGQRFFYPAADGKAGHFDVAKDAAGRCLFLDSDGLCIIHKELGPEAKPSMCLQFPFLSCRNPVDDRISVNYGCPAVQAREGIPLTQYEDKIDQLVPISQAACPPDTPWRLDAATVLAASEADAVFDRAMRIFADGREESIWTRFAELLTVLGTVQEFKTRTPADDQALLDFLASDDLRPDGAETPHVTGWENPSQVPMAVRLLFATTLFTDTLTKDASVSTGFFQRLRLVPKLMALAKLSGEYNSFFLGRRINITEVLKPEFDGALPEAGQQLLLRYFRSRFWQRFPAGTSLTIVSGVHQHIHDLNAVLFFGRALARDGGQSTLSDELIGHALQVVEFHFATQVRLHSHTLKGFLRSALDSLPLAAASLRLLAPMQTPVLELAGV